MQTLSPDLLQTLTHALTTVTEWGTVETLTAGYDKEAKALIWNSLSQDDRDRLRALKANQSPSFDPRPYVEKLRGCPLWCYVEDALEPLTAAQRDQVLNECGPELRFYIESLRNNWHEFAEFDYPEGCGVNPLTYWGMLNAQCSARGEKG